MKEGISRDKQLLDIATCNASAAIYGGDYPAGSNKAIAAYMINAADTAAEDKFNRELVVELFLNEVERLQMKKQIQEEERQRLWST